MAAFGQLGAGIAHEVKNPLAGILGCAQLSLRKAREGQRHQQNLELIEKETQRCKTIIENLLKFARQEKADMSSRPTSTHVVEDADGHRQPPARAQQVKLETSSRSDLPRDPGQREPAPAGAHEPDDQRAAGDGGQAGTVTVITRAGAEGRVDRDPRRGHRPRHPREDRERRSSSRSSRRSPAARGPDSACR